MEGLPTNVTPIAWREARHYEHFWNGFEVVRWPCYGATDSKYLIVEVKPRRVLVVPEHDLPAKFDSLIVGYWTDENDVNSWVDIPYTVEERR